MGRVLMLAHVASMIDNFNMSNIRILQELGCQVEVACNFEKGSSNPPPRIEAFKDKLDSMNVPYHNIPISRRGLDFPAHVRSVRRTTDLIRSRDITHVHCHSPIGGAVARIGVALTRHVQVDHSLFVIYTAHGFHFYKGASPLSWLTYFPVERALARTTDVLVTMNAEDFHRAQRFPGPQIRYVPGTGVDASAFLRDPAVRDSVRSELEVGDKVLLTSIGELSKRKNHRMVIEALASPLVPEDLIYAIAGIGSLRGNLESLAKKRGVASRVKFLGYRSDIRGLLAATDIFVLPSLQEGLPVALIEAMASGLPVVSSRIRGNIDLITDGEGGLLFDTGDIETLSHYLADLTTSPSLRAKFGSTSRARITSFDQEVVDRVMREIYLLSGVTT